MTATDTTHQSVITAYSGGSEAVISDLNGRAEEKVPSYVVVRRSSSGTITIANETNRAGTVVDFLGSFGKSALRPGDAIGRRRSSR